MICDEAHRTTGAILSDGDESNFVRIHDNDYLRADRRLYMTATPRIYSDAVKDKAEQHSAELVSMDDELRYGPEFHNLSFGDAVERGLLTDYKVLVLTIDESVIAAPMQQQLATLGELPLDDASKIVGCWNGLAKRAGASVDGEPSFAPGELPMQRAVAFARDIAASKQIASLFPRVVEAYQSSLDAQENDGHRVAETNRDLICEVHHVDGTYNALERNAELAWLKSPVAQGECRILTNARCLSEGVDVPALDAVLFLHPRNSIVDVVQSVGRVMRLSPDKDYGYVILPVAVPACMNPSEALADNQRFKVVWQVLNALRSHDERFDAMVNSIALNQGGQKTGQGTNQLLGAHIGPTTDDPPEAETTLAARPAQMALFSLSQWQEAVYTRIVEKVGTRVYWDQWASDVADIATAQIARINAVLNAADAEAVLTQQFERFLKGLRDNLNESVTRDDAISMLSQHLITKPVFDALFTEHDFASRNPVSQVMQAMVDALDGSGLEAETTRLEKFYASVRARAEQVVSAEGRQRLIADLYEKFFRTAFKKQSEALGIVYTPVEIVDFILKAADYASRTHLNFGLSDQNVHVLDGFTGTGTFLTRLLQSGLLTPADLSRKYLTELHANEIMLLAYYIAAVNIETTYHALVGRSGQSDSYEPFPGIALADTFQISEQQDALDIEVFATNNDRITAQLKTPINIIVGNPPWSIRQSNVDEDNANLAYPTLDKRIADTYSAKSTARNKNNLRDPYVRAFRWASDRIGDAGVVAFVSNGGWINGNTADGMRLILAEEYSHIYVFNLRGNMRVANWREEGEKIFGSGSQATVAIFVGVKDPAHKGACEIRYHRVDDFLTRKEKLATLARIDLDSQGWERITPNAEGDWEEQRNEVFASWPSLSSRNSPSTVTIFKSHSQGVNSGRDVWVYNFSKSAVAKNMSRMIDFYNEMILDGRTQPLVDPTRMSWTTNSKKDFARKRSYAYNHEFTRIGVYRPFTKQYVYFDREMLERVYQLDSIFYGGALECRIWVSDRGAGAPFNALMTDQLPNLTLGGAGNPGQFFPRWTYEKIETAEGTLQFTTTDGIDDHGYRKIDNITDDIQALYRRAVGEVTKDQIFSYIYASLHQRQYRLTYAADLKKMLPHVPTPDSGERFRMIADIGRQLADLHVNYEAAEPYPLHIRFRSGVDIAHRDTWRVTKMRWQSKADRSAIIYNSAVTIAGIPDQAHEYMLGSRSGLEWIIDRYQVKTDKPSGIVNDPNDWCDEHDDPSYIVDLIKKVTTVSVETMKLVAQLSGGSTPAETTSLP